MVNPSHRKGLAVEMNRFLLYKIIWMNLTNALSAKKTIYKEYSKWINLWPSKLRTLKSLTKGDGAKM